MTTSRQNFGRNFFKQFNFTPLCECLMWAIESIRRIFKWELDWSLMQTRWKRRNRFDLWHRSRSLLRSLFNGHKLYEILKICNAIAGNWIWDGLLLFQSGPCAVGRPLKFKNQLLRPPPLLLHLLPQDQSRTEHILSILLFQQMWIRLLSRLYPAVGSCGRRN